MSEFYLSTITEKTIAGDNLVTKDVLCFKQAKSGYDGKATKDHVAQNPDEYEAFRVKHPDYVLPERFTAGEIGAPVSVRQPDPVLPPVEPIAPVSDPEVDGERSTGELV